jgi:hypothetical protein
MSGQVCWESTIGLAIFNHVTHSIVKSICVKTMKSKLQAACELQVLILSNNTNLKVQSSASLNHKILFDLLDVVQF